MNPAVREMLKQFGNIKTQQDENNALQEIIQRITLLGLHRAKFYEEAAFYGGTALRMLYGLDRFSEDLDFCLINPNKNFTLAPFFESILAELARFGFEASITERKTGPDVAVESAFVKQLTYQGLILIERAPINFHKDQLIKIKLEVDKVNPKGAKESHRLIKLPVPFLVKTLTLESLFAGKLHAIIARSYLNRVKGRDYYDLLFYLARDTSVNIQYLEAKLRNSNHYQDKEPLSRERLLGLLRSRIESVDFEKAKIDVLPFISAENRIDLQDWSKDLFLALIEEIKIFEG